MRINSRLNTISYKAGYPVNAMNHKLDGASSAPEVNNGHVNMKRMLAEAKREEKNQFAGNSIISSSMGYSEQLKAQRESNKNTALEKKKLHYQFKDISSQIIRSKSSASARKAVGAARRELLRLKQQKNSGKYDDEEIEAAITHAKAMERVARKKVKHLEEEEMLRATGGLCADVEVEEEETLKKENGLDENDLENFSLEDMEALFAQMQDMSSELMDEMEEGMQDMLEEMGLDELSDSLMAAKGDMDPEDFKMMKIKHRCKEMKEMVEADSKYLKAIFDHYEKMKSGGASMPSSGGSSASFVSAPASLGGTPNVAFAAPAVSAPSIDISV